jgi:hypothetical protein
VQINDGNGWFSAGYSSAYGEDSYSVICHTPFDSTAYDPGLLDFRVIAAMDEGTYTSEVIVGWSVDNLKPSIPTGVDVLLEETLIVLSWDPCPDEDFDYFAIYRSEESGTFPEEPYGYTIETSFEDIIGEDDYFFYKITAVDFAGNESDGTGVISTYQMLDITIPQGWSGFSTRLNPLDDDVDDMFDPVVSDLVILQNQSGYYWPGQNVNTLGKWDILSGYAIKMNNQAGMTIASSRKLFRTIELNEGWGLIPVLSENSVNVIELFLDADIQIVKDVAGAGVYWPEQNVNSLVNVDPGKAYYVKSNSAGTIIYPILSDNSTGTIGGRSEYKNITPWNDVVNTPASHIVAFAGDALALLESGDVIGAFTTSGNCAGMTAYQNGEFALALMQNDIYSAQPDGFVENENLSFKLFRPSTNQVCDLEVAYDPTLDCSGKFHANGLSAITVLKISATGTEGMNEGEISIYPNPSTGEFLIEGIQGSTRIEVSTNAGLLVSTHQVNDDKTFNLSKLPKGLYLIKITNNKGIIVRKLVLR